MRELPLQLKHLGDKSQNLTLRESLYIRRNQPLVERASKTAIIHSLGLRPVGRALECFIGTNMTLLGSGQEQVVFMDSEVEGIFKVVMDSGNFPLVRQDVDAAAAELNEINEQCVAVAPHVWAPSHFSTFETTGSKGKRHIVVRQPYVRAQLPGDHRPFDLLANPVIDIGLRQKFAQGVIETVERVGVMPDFGGPNNVIYGTTSDRGGLHIVDTLPSQGSAVYSARSDGGQLSDYDKIARIACAV